jgi:hypothetical protein
MRGGCAWPRAICRLSDSAQEWKPTPDGRGAAVTFCGWKTRGRNSSHRSLRLMHVGALIEGGDQPAFNLRPNREIGTLAPRRLALPRWSASSAPGATRAEAAGARTMCQNVPRRREQGMVFGTIRKIRSTIRSEERERCWRRALGLRSSGARSKGDCSSNNGRADATRSGQGDDEHRVRRRAQSGDVPGRACSTQTETTEGLSWRT